MFITIRYLAYFKYYNFKIAERGKVTVFDPREYWKVFVYIQKPFRESSFTLHSWTFDEAECYISEVHHTQKI